MILSDFICILVLTLLCCKFGIAKNHALFGVHFFSLKLGWCIENDILQVRSKCCQIGANESKRVQICPNRSE